ncbi:MAG TPA: VOC family protein [Tepidisphaeraceae bacterium]|nr:VOC family protein [Tepidisphaeraceae bacterium]
MPFGSEHIITAKNRSVVRELVPLLFVGDIEASLAFYHERLGFDVVATWKPNNQLAWCRLERDGSAIMLQQAEEEDGPATGRGHGVNFYFNCDDVDLFYREVIERGLMAKAPTIAHYGERQLHLRDPDGYELCFQSPAKSA